MFLFFCRRLNKYWNYVFWDDYTGLVVFFVFFLVIMVQKLRYDFEGILVLRKKERKQVDRLYFCEQLFIIVAKIKRVQIQQFRFFKNLGRIVRIRDNGFCLFVFFELFIFIFFREKCVCSQNFLFFLVKNLELEFFFWGYVGVKDFQIGI